METLVLKAFTVLFRMVGILLLAGTMVAVLVDLQKLAFDSKRRGLVSMLSINEQLVGKDMSVSVFKSHVAKKSKSDRSL